MTRITDRSAKTKDTSQEDIKEPLERLYTYKTLSFAFYPNQPDENLNRLKRIIEETFHDEVPDGLKHLLQIVGDLSGLKNQRQIEEKIGEMKDLEPIERRLIPQLNLGTALADLVGFYKAFGLENAGDLTVDHFSVETEFMAHLILKEAYATSRGNGEMEEIIRDAEKKFLRDHLSRSVVYLAALRQKLPELAEIAAFGESFLKDELDRYGLPNLEAQKGSKESSEDVVQCPFA